MAMISIIDDDEPAREATKGLLRSLGYSVLAFSSAEEFLASERINDSACVITDLQMPGLSGLELQDRLAAQGQKVPLIFITGYPEEGQRQRAMQAGAAAFIAKPFRDAHLISCINRALRKDNPGTA